jgi:quinol monooxygenase YgiN
MSLNGAGAIRDLENSKGAPMSVYVITEFHARPGSSGKLIDLLRRLVPESLEHDGCEGVAIRHNQDDPDNIISLTQWRTRGHYESYLAWRTEIGDTGSFEKLLDTPMSIRYYDQIDITGRVSGSAGD